VTSDQASTDAISVRLIHNFSSTGPGFGPPGGAGGARGGGGRNRRGPRNNINFGFNWTRASTNLVNSFPSLAGHTNTQGLNANSRWTYGKGKLTNTVGFTYNHNRAASTNLYSGVTDVAGNAGITGISQDPFDWGLPGIGFTSFGGLTDPTPSRELDQTYTVSDTVIWNHGKQNWRFGGDYRRILQGFRSARNAEGSFVFTGFATSAYLPGSTQPLPGTGNDFADFLLGLPQQSTLQSGTTDYEFRANSYDLYAQNDWRVLPNLSVNLGLRYEYVSPFSESENRIANLDVSFSPESVTAFRVLNGQAGPFTGSFPATLVHPDRNNFAPRIGIAYRLGKQTVVRSGYGINYNLAQYGSFIRNFAFQPPFATTATNVSPYGDFLTLQNGSLHVQQHDNEQLRSFTKLPARLRANLESRYSAATAGQCSAQHRIQRRKRNASGHGARTGSFLRFFRNLSGQRSFRSVHLRIFGGRLNFARSFGAHPEAALEGYRRKCQLHFLQVHRRCLVYRPRKHRRGPKSF
jgi:outer membrane receptor protein involved in Fe transport